MEETAIILAGLRHANEKRVSQHGAALLEYSIVNQNPHETFDVILPAGGRIRENWARDAGSQIKTLLKLNDETILRRTIRVLRETENIGRIVVIGPKELEAESEGANVLLDEGETGPDNIFRGLNWLEENANRVLDWQKTEDRKVLVMTTDLPFFSSENVSQFLESCPRDADICIPIVERAPFEKRFPDAAGFWVPLNGKNWTLGCAFLLKIDAMHRSRAHIERVFAARKSQIQMAKLLGASFILRLLLRKLTVAQVQQKCERVLDCRGSVIQNAAPELAFDIDDEAAWIYATQQQNEPEA